MLGRCLLGQLGARARKADGSHLSVFSGYVSSSTDEMLVFSYWGTLFLQQEKSWKFFTYCTTILEIPHRLSFLLVQSLLIGLKTNDSAEFMHLFFSSLYLVLGYHPCVLSVITVMFNNMLVNNRTHIQGRSCKVIKELKNAYCLVAV